MLARRCLTPHTLVPAMMEAITSGPPGPWPAGWPSWANTKEAHRRLATAFVARLRAPPDRGHGRGIVLCAGGLAYFPSAWVCVQTLRRLGCTLPVQVWHLGESEMDPGMERLLAPLGVTCVDAGRLAEVFPCRILNGWELKAYAILHCPFREVLFLDADCAPVKDPTFLFDCPPYRHFGAVFWPDFPQWRLGPHVWRTFGMPVPTGSSPSPARGPGAAWEDAPLESGQILIDKGRCWRELRLALWYCEHSDFVFQHVHGDKETFRLAWRRLGTPYAMPGWWPGWDLHTILQTDFEGEVLFQHRCQDKWRLDGSNRPGQTLHHEAWHFALVEDLRRRWSGLLWRNGSPTRAERAARQRLAGRLYEYHRVGHDRRTLELRADGRVGRGAARCEARWSVFVTGGQTLLALCQAERPTCVLRCGADGVWRGRWLAFERMPVELSPAPCHSRRLPA
jgi:hypothetical protein